MGYHLLKAANGLAIYGFGQKNKAFCLNLPGCLIIDYCEDDLADGA